MVSERRAYEAISSNQRYEIAKQSVDSDGGEVRQAVGVARPRPERAAEKYESIRKKLIQIFIYRGCNVADELADETIDRVSYKIDELFDSYVGDPRLYFYGVARNVHREYLQKQRLSTPLVLITRESAEEVELKHNCLERCLRNLPEDDQDLILEYYREEKRDKIERRKRLAPGGRPNTLRKRTQRIRERLKSCIGRCMKAEE